MTAAGGTIGGASGWSIGSNKLTSQGGSIALDGNSSEIIVGAGSNIVRLSGTNDVVISVGSLTPSSAPFQVSKYGDVTGSNVQFTGGTIGGFTITSSELKSSSTFKRGLQLKPGDAIRGYGNEVHKTRTVVGKFTFGLGSIAPAAGADTPFDPTQAPPPGGATP